MAKIQEVLDKSPRFVIKTLKGLEPVLAQEVKNLGGTKIIEGTRSVECQGNLELLYKLNLWLRTGLSVLIELDSFDARNTDELYKKASNFAWEQLIPIDKTFAIDAVVYSEQFNHSKFAALRLKDAIADRFMKVMNRRPDVDPYRPDYKLVLHISQNAVTISLDSSGPALYKRGYKTGRHPAPMNEVLAAGILLLLGYHGQRPIHDIFCGSGTIAIEAALIATNRAPGITRNYFGFMSWDNYDASLFKKVQLEAVGSRKASDQAIFASDISSKFVTMAEAHAKNAGVFDAIQFNVSDFEQVEIDFENGWIIGNPPYDDRLDMEDDVEFYKAMGDYLKFNAQGNRAAIFSGNLHALKFVGLKPSKKVALLNGRIESKLHVYELYSGTKKQKN